MSGVGVSLLAGLDAGVFATAAVVVAPATVSVVAAVWVLLPSSHMLWVKSAQSIPDKFANVRNAAITASLPSFKGVLFGKMPILL